MINKINKNLITVSLLLVLLPLLYSCRKDDLVTPSDSSYQFDSARFNYSVLRLEGKQHITGDLWAEDTSEVFIVNSFMDDFIHVENGIIKTYHYPDFTPSSISGINKQEVYVAGLKREKASVLPALKKWNGSILEDITIDLNFNKPTYINKSLVRNSSDMWLFCNNTIIRKDGNKFNTYQLDDTIPTITIAYFDKQNVPTYCQAYFNTSIDSNLYVKVYKFYNNSWNKIYDAIDDLNSVYDKFNRSTFCKRDLYNVYIFENDGFTPFFSTDVLEILGIGGN